MVKKAAEITPEEPTEPKKAAKPDSSSKNARMKRQTLLMIIPLALAAVLAYVYLSKPKAEQGDPAPAAVVDTEAAADFSLKIVNHLRQGQCSEIYDQTSLGFQASATREQWTSQCAVASSVLTGAAEGVEVADTVLTDDIVETSYQIKGTDEKTYIVRVETVNRDGQWQLQGINSSVAE